MIQPERIKILKRAPSWRRRFVLYWMQAAQRGEFNHALEYAARNVRYMNAAGLRRKFDADAYARKIGSLADTLGIF